MTEYDARDADWLPRFQSDVGQLLRAQLFLSPIELLPLLQLAPIQSCDAVVVFTQNERDANGVTHEVVIPRQSFAWIGSERKVVAFSTIEDVHRRLLGRVLEGPSKTKGQPPMIHFLAELNAEVARSKDSGYRTLWSDDEQRAVSVYVRQDEDDEGKTARFFEHLAPYLEMYRVSTVQNLNETYKVRNKELGNHVRSMTSSPAETAWLCVEKVINHTRVGPTTCSLYEFRPSTTQGGRHWTRIRGLSSGADAEQLELLEHSETRRMLEADKVRGEIIGTKHVLIVPFRTPNVEYLESYDDAEADTRPQALDDGSRCGSRQRSRRYQIEAKQAGMERLVPGDLAIVVHLDQPPRPTLLHTIAAYRQLYFGTVLPRIKQAARNAVDSSSRALMHPHATAAMGSAKPDVWDSVRNLCEDVMPTFCEALRISIGINIFNIGNGSLDLLYRKDHAQTIRNPDFEGQTSLDLRTEKPGKERGVVATTFLQRVEHREDDYKNVPDVRLYRGYIPHRQTTASEYCRKLWFRKTPIGTINFESDCRNRFTESVRRELDELTLSLEHYIERFLSSQDANWLSISAASYHHLHELRQEANAWPPEIRQRVEGAIASFDTPSSDSEATLADLQQHLSRLLEDYLDNAPGPARRPEAALLDQHCRFNVCGPEGAESARTLSMERLELVLRIAKNLSSNFFRDAIRSSVGRFTIQLIHRPFDGIRLDQDQPEVQEAQWLRDACYRPIEGARASDRNHHGLFLCGAIARFLGGYAWAGNRDGKDGRPGRSKVSIIVPLEG